MAPVPTDVASRVFSLPMHPYLTQDQIQFIVACLKSVIGKNANNNQQMAAKRLHVAEHNCFDQRDCGCSSFDDGGLTVLDTDLFSNRFQPFGYLRCDHGI